MSHHCDSFRVASGSPLLCSKICTGNIDFVLQFRTQLNSCLDQPCHWTATYWHGWHILENESESVWYLLPKTSCLNYDHLNCWINPQLCLASDNSEINCDKIALSNVLPLTQLSTNFGRMAHQSNVGEKKPARFCRLLMLQKVGQGQLQILSDGRFYFRVHLSPGFSRTMTYQSQSFLILLFGIKLVEPLHDPINAKDVLVQAQLFSWSKL